MKYESLHILRSPAFATDLLKSLVPILILLYLAPLFYNDPFLFALLAVMLTSTNALNIVYGFTGYLPFGFAAFVAVGAYASAISINLMHFGLLEGVLFGGLSSVALSMVLTPLLKLNGAYFAIASLAAFEAAYYIFSNPALNSVTGGPYGISINAPYTPQLDYTIVAVLAIVSSLVVLLLRKTDFGLALQAIKDDRYAAEMSGINSFRYRIYAWIMSTFLTGCAGAMFGIYLGFFYPGGVFDLTQFSVLVIIFLIFGGRGTYLGPLIGTAILFFTYQILEMDLPSLYLLAFGLIIVLTVLFMPDGVVSLISKRVRGVF